MPSLQIRTTHNNTLVRLHQHKHTTSCYGFVNGFCADGAPAGGMEVGHQSTRGPGCRLDGGDTISRCAVVGTFHLFSVEGWDRQQQQQTPYSVHNRKHIKHTHETRVQNTTLYSEGTTHS